MAEMYAVKKSDLTAIADAIRLKREIVSDIEVEDMATQIGLIDGGGGIEPETVDSIINGTISGDYINTTNESGIKNGLFIRSRLTSVTFEKATSTGFEAFRYSTSLVSANFPLAIEVSNYSFNSCTNLASVNFPNVTRVGAYSLMVTALTTLTLPSATAIQDSALANSANLTKLILGRASGVCAISVSALSGTPFASGGSGGTIYVPRALISNYQANTSWATILSNNPNNQIKAIEDM